MGLSSLDLLSPPETQLPDSVFDITLTIYRAVISTDYGISSDNRVITGLELVPWSWGHGYDALNEEVAEIGSEMVLHLPDEGLVEGCFYRSDCCHLGQPDWETGYVEEWDICIYKIMDGRIFK